MKGVSKTPQKFVPQLRFLSLSSLKKLHPTIIEKKSLQKSLEIRENCKSFLSACNRKTNLGEERKREGAVYKRRLTEAEHEHTWKRALRAHRGGGSPLGHF